MENIISTVLISAFSSFLTFQFSIVKFRSEKWWELKVLSYQKIIEALHESKLFSSLHLEADEEGVDVTDQKADELRVRARKANEEILRTIDIGTFLLSNNAIERLHRFMRDSDQASKEEGWHGYLEADYIATKSCLDDLIIIAKEDLDKTYGRSVLIFFKKIWRGVFASKSLD